MSKNYRFNRMEIAGSLGDLGVLMPLALGMIVLNGLLATNVMIMVGLFYIMAGLYFRVPLSVQPMKVIGAYALAVGMTPNQIMASSLWMGGILLLLGGFKLIIIIRKYTPKSVIRGVQLAVGMALMLKGFNLMLQKDPGLTTPTIGSLSTGILLGAAAMILTLLLLNNRKVPAAMVVILLGFVLGLVLGKPMDTSSISWGFHLPKPIPHGWPSGEDFLWVLPVVVLPQLPMTIGNAIIANTDLSHEYFPEKKERVTYRSVTLSQGLANVAAFFFGGIPMCHGAGGLAAHYRFGARTGGSNLIIGGLLVLLSLGLGENLVPVLKLIPLSILGALLVFSGLQLALSIQELSNRKELFVVFLMLGLSLVFSLTAAFIAGFAIAYLLKYTKLEN